MKKIFKLLGWVLGTVIIMTMITPNLSWALQAGGIGVMPVSSETYPDRKGWFVYEEVEPSTVIEDVARIINLDNKPNTITIEAVDAFMTQDGGFALRDSVSDNTDIGSWITLSQTEITLDAQQEQLVPFTITIPDNVEVGDHIGGIAVYRSEGTPEQTLKRGGAAVSISTRVGARVYLTIKGDIVRDLALKKRALYGRQEHLAFRFKLENLGNVRADMTLSAKIYGIFGLFDTQDNISLGQIFPKQTSTIETLWPGKNRPLFGPYFARITLTDTFRGLNPESSTLPPSEPIHTWAVAFFVPWTQVAVLVFLLFLIWLIRQVWLWRGLVRLSRVPVVAYKIKKGDHIIDIAASYHVSWKLVAKLNHIASPYSLHGLTHLYIPDARGQQHHVATPLFWKPLLSPLGRVWQDLSKLRRASSPHTPPEYAIVLERGDKKKDIEEFTGLTWAVIAKHNALPKSFKFKAGVELQIPGKKPKP